MEQIVELVESYKPFELINDQLAMNIEVNDIKVRFGEQSTIKILLERNLLNVNYLFLQTIENDYFDIMDVIFHRVDLELFLADDNKVFPKSVEMCK
jgi:hypothetical protein